MKKVLDQVAEMLERKEIESYSVHQGKIIVEPLSGEEKPLFTNSLGEKFFEGDRVYFVGKLTLRILSQNIDEILFYKENKGTTEIMTKESAEKWIEEHTKKEIEPIKGEIYFCTCKGSGNSYVFRADAGVYKTSHSTSVSMDDNSFSMNPCITPDDDIKTLRLVTEEEKAKLIKAEEEHDKFWSDEKKDFLKLEDVYYKADIRQDLKDISNVVDISMLSDCYDFNMSRLCVFITPNNTILNANSCNMNRLQVNKQTFITLLKNHK